MGLAVFLASPASDFINGQVVYIDGGISAYLGQDPGNLDESNTIVIMDLLKSISKEHLVLLVTHESELVDHYCEQVIELKDGHIENLAAPVWNWGAFYEKMLRDVISGSWKHDQTHDSR